MTCCGPLAEITTQEDRCPVYLCRECGKQGPASDFPDPEPPEPEPETWLDKIRWKAADFLGSIAARVAPKLF